MQGGKTLLDAIERWNSDDWTAPVLKNSPLGRFFFVKFTRDRAGVTACSTGS